MSPLCFRVERGEVVKLDPLTNHPDRRALTEAVERSPFAVGRVGDICEEIYDGLHGIRRYVDGGVPLLGVGNTTEEGLDLSEVNRIAPEEHARLTRSQVSKGDVLVTITGRLGTAMVYNQDDEANLSAHVARIRVRPEHNAGYLAAYFNSSVGKHFISLNEVGSTHPHINVNRLEDVTLVIPPRSVQDSIAELMSAAYVRRGGLESHAQDLLASVDGYLLNQVGRNWGADPRIAEQTSAAAVFTVWRRDVSRLDPKRYRWQSRIDDTQGLRHLGELLIARREKVDRGQYAFEDLQLITIHFDGGIEPREIPSWRTDIKGALYFAHPGDLVYSKIDARNGAIGIVPADMGRVAVTTEYPTYEVKEEVILPGYLKLVLRSSRFRALLKALASGHSGRKRIYPDMIEEIYIPVPAMDSQREIVAEVGRRRQRAGQLRSEGVQIVAQAKVRVERAIVGEADL